MILGLDIATTTGFALGEPGERPLSWSERLGEAGSSHDARFSTMLSIILRLIKQHEPVLVMLEAPIKTRRDSKGTNELLMGLAAVVRAVCYAKGVPCRQIEIPTLDKHFISIAGMKSEERKRAIWGRCKQLGWNPPDQDAADACAVWDFACSTRSRAHSIQNLPLMVGR